MTGPFFSHLVMAAHDDDMYDRQMGAQRKEQKTFKGLFQGEIYAKAEVGSQRAAPGEAFPAKQDSSIIPIQDIFREIKEEEEQDAH
eukprot:gene28115-34791_t